MEGASRLMFASREDAEKFHSEKMRAAIELAKHCKPHDPKRTPRLGVVITRGDATLAQAFRGTGQPGDDKHAEDLACAKVARPEELAGATVYTTLEPCTRHSRRSTTEPCTDLLVRHRVAKVVIGILDPNQTVCGRGFNQLQEADIEVEMFPHALAGEVRAGNKQFLIAQQTYSPKFITPAEGDKIQLKKQDRGGYYREFPVQFECILPPSLDLYLVLQNGAYWWPQRWNISRIADTNNWQGTVGIGSFGRSTIHIVKANTFGVGVVNYYREVMSRNHERAAYLREKLADKNLSKEFWDGIPSIFQPLQFNELPNGLDSLANVTIETIPPE